MDLVGSRRGVVDDLETRLDQITVGDEQVARIVLLEAGSYWKARERVSRATDVLPRHVEPAYGSFDELDAAVDNLGAAHQCREETLYLHVRVKRAADDDGVQHAGDVGCHVA